MLAYIPNIIFIIFFTITLFFFTRNVKRIYRNINLGIPIDRNDNKKQRWAQMLRIAFGQSKMIDKPIVGILHIVVYLGFLVINIELLEILFDGFFGTHMNLYHLLNYPCLKTPFLTNSKNTLEVASTSARVHFFTSRI